MYATQQNLIDRFGEQELIELTDRADPPAGTIDAAVVDGALGDADELINSYIGKRYDLPLAEVPAVLVRVASDLARYFLYDDARPDTVTKPYDDAVKFLRDIASGAATLAGAAGDPPAQSSDGVELTGPERVFTRDSLGGF